MTRTNGQHYRSRPPADRPSRYGKRMEMTGKLNGEFASILVTCYEDAIRMSMLQESYEVTACCREI